MKNLPFAPESIRGVTFDLDDTLLRDDLTVSSFTVSVMRELSRRGVAVLPASGRASLLLASASQARLGLSPPDLA